MTYEEAVSYLRKVVAVLPQPWEKICSVVVEDSRFQEAPGGSKNHHAYPHGLILHVVEVHQITKRMAAEPDVRLVLDVATVWHDYHKVLEYELRLDHPTEAFHVENLPYRKLIGHVAGSYHAFMSTFEKHGSPWDLGIAEQVAHCILSHHGRREWGSPVEPATLAAYLLHSADMLSAKGEL